MSFHELWAFWGATMAVLFNYFRRLLMGKVCDCTLTPRSPSPPAGRQSPEAVPADHPLEPRVPGDHGRGRRGAQYASHHQRTPLAHHAQHEECLHRVHRHRPHQGGTQSGKGG